MSASIESNLWKYVLIQMTNRRSFLPILSIYYLTLPNANAQEIGIYTGLWFLAAMVMQLPSGFIADHLGQKNTLIISKILILISSVCYFIGESFWIFAIWAMCMWAGLDAFASGTTSSFLKWTLEKIWRWDEYRVLAARISGNVSLFSAVLIILLPMFATIHIKAPFLFAIAFDSLGLLVATRLVPIHEKIEKHEKKKLLPIIRELREAGFFPYALFSAVIGSFLFVDSVYRSPYLLELGYPLAYIGFVMAASRVVWWVVGRSIKYIERHISFHTIIGLEVILFPLYYVLVGYITNPWILGVVFSLVVWWFWGRNEIYTDMLLSHIPDKKYRATGLSVKTQIGNIMQVILSFSIAWVMAYSYQFGFQILGWILFLLLAIIYIFGIRKSIKTA